MSSSSTEMADLRAEVQALSHQMTGIQKALSMLVANQQQSSAGAGGRRPSLVPRGPGSLSSTYGGANGDLHMLGHFHPQSTRSEIKAADERESAADLLALGLGLMNDTIALMKGEYDANDVDLGGDLSAEELADMIFKVAKIRCSKDQASAIIKNFDLDGNQRLDFFEVINMIGTVTGLSSDHPGDAATALKKAASLRLMTSGIGGDDVDGDGCDEDGHDTAAKLGSVLIKNNLGSDQIEAERAELELRKREDYQKREYQRMLKAHSYLIHPYRPFHQCWDVFVAAVLFVTIITIPLSLGYEELNDQMLWLNFTIDCIFMLDVVKNFFTGYVDKNDRVIMVHKRIIKRYLSTWFLPDVVSSIPFDLITKFGVSNTSGFPTQVTKTLKLLRLMRLAKLFRLLKVSRIFKYMRKMKGKVKDGGMRGGGVGGARWKVEGKRRRW